MQHQEAMVISPKCKILALLFMTHIPNTIALELHVPSSFGKSFKAFVNLHCYSFIRVNIHVYSVHVQESTHLQVEQGYTCTVLYFFWLCNESTKAQNA